MSQGVRPTFEDGRLPIAGLISRGRRGRAVAHGRTGRCSGAGQSVTVGLMPNTKLLAEGNPTQVDPVQSELAQLDLSAYRIIRLSVGNWEGSPGPVVIAISQVDQPNTPNANLIASVDSFTLAPDESASKVYEVPGEVVVFLANPEQPPLSGIQVFVTIYGRTD